jgi:hypothetical protein
MERIMTDARSDAKLNQIECDIQLVKMSYAEFLQEYDNELIGNQQHVETNTAARTELVKQLNSGQDGEGPLVH